ncbi:hypothetical protein GXP71_14065 [Cellulomonas sp. H30R-01]|uniref:hypothetical protein n=1 Tax=Cellulomonas sp. H30R-01 TaxID=2704467 RepID=UPI00138C3CBD|nr:hypothetical protein [Cellulomonas sp. H30R-01]QHT57094.1 hypothetical protein GXP71_14065 [Cellulomonas sp. H30R-01]
MPRLYATPGPTLRRQVTGDVVALVVVAAAVWLAVRVHGAVWHLADPVRSIGSGADGIADQLAAGRDGVADVPLVGEPLSAPLDGASDGAAAIAAASYEQVQAVERLALVLAVAVVAVPLLVALVARIGPRVRWWRLTRDVRRLSSAGRPGDRVLALRALTSAAPRDLLAVHPDPAAAWGDDDAPVVRDLAALHLRTLGVARR